MTPAIVAEFRSVPALKEAVRALRDRGYSRLDAYTPHPVHGLEELLALPRTPLNWIVFPLSMLGAGLAFLVQVFCNAWDYPINNGGRPALAVPAFVPITFEMGVLSAAFASLIGLFILCRLPRLAHPIFDAEGFESVTVDGYWVGVAPDDPLYDAERTAGELRDLGAARVQGIGQ